MSDQEKASAYIDELLCCLVLKTIGELSKDDEGKIVKLERWLRDFFKYEGSGDWGEMVAHGLQLPSDFKSVIIGNYMRYATHCAASLVPLDPRKFAIDVVSHLRNS